MNHISLQQNESIQKPNVEWKNPETWQDFKCDAIPIKYESFQTRQCGLEMHM